MSYVNQTNIFFKEKVYSNLGKFAVSPVSWAFTDSQDSSDNHDSNMARTVIDLFKDILRQTFKNLLLIAASPVLIPATIITATLAFCSALVSAIVHTIALAFLGTADVINSRSLESQPLLM